MVFKTLVCKGASGGYYVFDIPVAETLDLKKAARAVGEKSVAMLPQKELLPLTGYVHGGCSPVGMKKQFPTVFHETAESLSQVAVSAGKIGYQVAHRLELNHGPRFWKVVESLFPARREAEAWLRHHGASLHRYGA